MADPFQDSSGNFTYGYIADEANILEDNGLITTSATESFDYGLVADEILYSVQLQGIDLTAQAGNISENVVDIIQILGIEAASTAQSITANGIANPVIILDGAQSSTNSGLITASGGDVAPEEYMGGRYTTQNNDINATAQVQTARAIAFAGRVTPRGFTVINGGARVFSIQTEAQINEATASGQLGIDDESLLMLLVA